ncbi:hypothetical protein JL720_10711 [Aureococcus anophagefferens]|nr:hypothetical protein JL720_10711 [Aureococcus anophagefferens]
MCAYVTVLTPLFRRPAPAGAFFKPVDKKQFPQYYVKITDPVDLTTIKERLGRYVYRGAGKEPKVPARARAAGVDAAAAGRAPSPRPAAAALAPRRRCGVAAPPRASAASPAPSAASPVPSAASPAPWPRAADRAAAAAAAPPPRAGRANEAPPLALMGGEDSSSGEEEEMDGGAV